MSRIGKLPITLPVGVEVTVSKENVVTVKGKLGELSQEVKPVVTVEVEEGVCKLRITEDTKENNALHGLYRALVHNMVIGVSEGYKTVLELVGVGYKATTQGQLLELGLGFSHNIMFELPSLVKVETVTERGKNPLITLTSIDKQLLGMVVSKVRSMRPPEPYKGKGVLFQGEEIRRKDGKTAAS